jgi:hypothetical protein
MAAKTDGRNGRCEGRFRCPAPKFARSRRRRALMRIALHHEAAKPAGKSMRKLTQEKQKRAFPEWGLRHLTGGLRGGTRMGGDWQNLSIRVSESVILGESRVTDEVTIPHSTAENTEFWSRRTSDFRHLGLWPSECDSTSELVIQPNSQTETRTI